MTSTYLATASAKVSLRPSHFAYVLRPRSYADLRWAIEHATSEWGGMSSVMLPGIRRPVPPLYGQVAAMVRPDYVVDLAGWPTTKGDEAAASIGGMAISREQADHEGAHALIAVDPDRLRARTLIVGGDDSLLQAWALGTVAPEQERMWREAADHVRPVEDYVDLLDGQLDVPSPLHLTLENAGVHEHSASLGGPVIVITHRITLRSAVHYWNLRATAVTGLGSLPRTRLVWLPPPALADERVWERLRLACASANTDPDLVLLGPDARALRRAARDNGFLASPAKGKRSTRLFPVTPRDLREDPLRFMVNRHPAAWLFGDRKYGVLRRVPVAVTKPKLLLHVDAPIAWRTGYGGHARFEFDDIEELRWPRDPAVARLIDRNATYGPQGLSLLTTAASRYDFRLAVPEPVEVATAILGARGWRWEVSDKGRYAEALAEAADGSLDALLDPIALEVCQVLASRSRLKAVQMLRQLDLEHVSPDEVVRAVGDAIVASSPRSRPLKELTGATGATKVDVLPVLERLIDARLVRRGFRFECSRCGLTTAVSLPNADDRLECPGCQTVSVLSGPPGEEPSLVYALNSLLDRAIDQDCVSHAIVARWAELHIGVLWGVPGALVNPAAGRPREVDYLGVSRDAITIAEMKASAHALDADLAAGMIELAGRLGASRVVLGTPDHWPAAERRRLEDDTARDGIELTLLGRDELLPHRGRS